MDALKPPSFFGNAEPPEILRLLAYHPQHFDDSVVSIPTKEGGPLVVTDLHPTCATLGDLDSLPFELFNKILRCSDLHAVSEFCSLNWRARALAISSYPYKLISQNAPHVVAALEKTGTASHFSVDDVLHALSTPSCHVCGKFGAYLWIPECIRCCFPCMQEAPELMPMSERAASAAFGLTKNELSRVPIMTTLPGVYTRRQRTYRRQRQLLSRERARQAAIDIHGGEEELARYINHGTSKAKIAYDQRVAALDAAAAVQNAHNRTKNDPTRFMAVVPLPYLDLSSDITHIGLACQGCEFVLDDEVSQHLPISSYRGDETYTTEGILEHFKSCWGARELWKAHRKMVSPRNSSDDAIPLYVRYYVQFLHDEYFGPL
jgi:hypothetical protein